MKIDNNNNINNTTDFMELVNKFHDEYGIIFWDKIGDEFFIYRPLGRLEYRELMNSDLTNEELEDEICRICLLYPENYDLNSCLAGIPKELSDLILTNSFLKKLEDKKQIINYRRLEMNDFDNQITCIINEAFPNHDIEEIEQWGMDKTAKYLSRAEWKLQILRNLPVNYEESDNLLEKEWIMEHSKNRSVDSDLEESNNEYNNTKEDSNNEENYEFKVETLEEREKRLKNSKTRKKTKEEIAELKRRFPEINWEAEIDPNININDMRDNIDVTSPALRPGY